MEKLNFNRYINLSQKDKKILTFFYTLLSKKFSDIYNTNSFELLRYLISKIGKNTMHPYDILSYVYKVKYEYKNFTKPNDTEYHPTVDADNIGMDKDYVMQSYFEYYYLNEVVENSAFQMSMFNCFDSTPIKLEGKTINNGYTGERWVEEDKTFYLNVGGVPSKTFPLMLSIKIKNKHQFFFVSVMCRDEKIEVELRGEGERKNYTFPVFWDDIRKIGYKDLSKFICEKIKPLIIDFIHEYLINNYDDLIELNENIKKNKKMKKIIKLTESDIEKIINKIIESDELDYYDDTLSEGRKKAGTKLCSRGKAAAKSKFKVYPSAYANGYAVQVCKGRMPGLDGKKRCSSPYC